MTSCRFDITLNEAMLTTAIIANRCSSSLLTDNNKSVEENDELITIELSSLITNAISLSHTSSAKK